MIDFGCGSGILAIAALKLGAKRAIGIDIDPQAILASTNNAEANGVADRLELFLAKDQPADLQADVVVANIFSGAAEGVSTEYHYTCKTARRFRFVRYFSHASRIGLRSVCS